MNAICFRNLRTCGPSWPAYGVDGAVLFAILVTDTEKHSDKAAWLPKDVRLTADADEFFDCTLDVIVEAAGQPTVEAYGDEEPLIHGIIDFDMLLHLFLQGQ